MIIEFDRLYNAREFLEKFCSTEATKLFDFKNVKFLKEFIVGYEDMETGLDRRFQNLVNRELVYIDDCGAIIMPVNTIGSLELDDNKAVLHLLAGEDVEFPAYELDEVDLAINLTDLGNKCMEANDDIEDIFDTVKYVAKIDQFYTSAPKTFVKAFEVNEVTECFKTERDLSERGDDEPWMDDICDMISDALKDCIKSIKDLEGPDDCMYSAWKKIDMFNGSADFSISGKFICCFYTQSKVKFSDIAKVINGAKFDKFIVESIEQPSNTPGISFNGIYGDDQTIYIQLDYKMEYTVK